MSAEAQATTARAALAVIVKAVGLDLPMKPSEASVRVMERVEELVDEANRLAAERDSLAEALKPLIEAVEASEMREAYWDEVDAARAALLKTNGERAA